MPEDEEICADCGEPLNDCDCDLEDEEDEDDG